MENGTELLNENTLSIENLTTQKLTLFNRQTVFVVTAIYLFENFENINSK